MYSFLRTRYLGKCPLALYTRQFSYLKMWLKTPVAHNVPKPMLKNLKIQLLWQSNKTPAFWQLYVALVLFCDANVLKFSCNMESLEKITIKLEISLEGALWNCWWLRQDTDHVSYMKAINDQARHGHLWSSMVLRSDWKIVFISDAQQAGTKLFKT